MTYRERREARAERLRDWAGKREAKAAAARAESDRISGMIPMGQPILAGHHSEKRHRRDIDRIDRGMRATIEHGAKAERMNERADNIDAQAEHAIYSDDPDAIERLCERRNWTTVGERFGRERFERVVAGLTWQRPMPRRLPAMPGLGIEACIEQLKIPSVSGVAIDGMFTEPDGPETATYSVYAAVVDGVVRDTHDPSRDGTRCVYGYWREPAAA